MPLLAFTNNGAGRGTLISFQTGFKMEGANSQAIPSALLTHPSFQDCQGLWNISPKLIMQIYLDRTPLKLASQGYSWLNITGEIIKIKDNNLN